MNANAEANKGNLFMIQFSSNRFRYLRSPRFWLAGPATLVVAVLVMAAMSLWLPKGQAGIDHLVVPLVLFPFIWAAVFFYVVLEAKPKRLYWVMLLLFLVNGGLVAASIKGLLS